MLAPGITSHAVDDGGNAVRLALGTRKRPEQQGIDRPLGSIERGFAGKPRDGLQTEFKFDHRHIIDDGPHGLL